MARYGTWFDRSQPGHANASDYDHTETVNDYYDLCSEIMQFGWNESLHFAPLKPGETLEESIVRHQRQMIEKLKLREGMKVIDVGCGVGGPMRRVARESGARVLCLNNNAQQLDQARRKNVAAGLDHMADYMKCNFMDMSAIDPCTFDGGYAIESTCHAPDKRKAFAEIYRVLKPGALFWGQEMCMTDDFDPDNSRHRAIKGALMLGNRPARHRDFLGSEPCARGRWIRGDRGSGSGRTGRPAHTVVPADAGTTRDIAQRVSPERPWAQGDDRQH